MLTLAATLTVRVLTVRVLSGLLLTGSAVWPLHPAPEVTREFDPPGSEWGAGHRGVDLLGSVGQQVRAARAGTVAYAGRLAGRGVVVVSHGPTRTTYEPVTAVVAVGDRVAAGQPIGRLQLGGSHCLPRACLHWGFLRGETYLDPLLLAGSGPVRLLPLYATLPLAGPWGWLVTLAGAPGGMPSAAGRW